MSQRSVPRPIMMFGVRQFPIFCCSCTQRDGMPANRHHYAIPWSVYQRYFHHKGWEFGRSGREDVCPQCVNRERIERGERRLKAMLDEHRREEPIVLEPQSNYSRIKALQRKFNHLDSEKNEIAQLRERVRILEKKVNDLKIRNSLLQQGRPARFLPARS